MAADTDGKRRPELKTSFWYDPRIRSAVTQAVVLVGFIGLILWFVDNTLTNLASRGIAAGFGFIDTTAGFGINFSLINFSETNTYGRAFLVGLLNTLLIASAGILVATILGFIVGVMRLSSNWLVAKIAAAYVETVRNVPLLLQILFWNFGVLGAMPHPRQSLNLLDSIFVNKRGIYVPEPVTQPGFWLIPLGLFAAIVGTIVLARWAKQRQMRTGHQFPTIKAGILFILGLPLVMAVLTGFPLQWNYPELQGFNFGGGLHLVPEFLAVLAALSFYTAGFIAEIVRSGILAVSKGQTEASMALGLTRNQMLRLVVIPQAMRVIVPPLTSQYLSLTKNSSLAAAVGYPELVAVFSGTVLNQTGQAVEIIAITMMVYLFISLVISFFMNLYNRSIALKER